MAKVTKERVANICKRINEGMRPSYAAKAEGLGGGYLIALKNSGIVYKDDQGNWKAMVKIHSSRYESFLHHRIKYDQGVVRSRYTTKQPEVVVVKQEGMFRRIWRSIFG
jgi:hypothetical protein